METRTKWAWSLRKLERDYVTFS